ncbi:NUDIX domain-containing protein [Mesobacillus jeotgali]|uniref:NUDIX domain-containing protein n=1 Tax=Mesobacillus jeotgali TaxID=129985 RepID=UPI0009A6DC0D|nr:NUDIX domain-containing protein [Mesobacillus jeotgali]
MIIFGKKDAGVQYIWRPGVYGIIFNDNKDQIALVSTDDGKYFLPGGGLENGESHEECLVREGREEIGKILSIGEWVGKAQRYFYSTKDEQHYLGEGNFYFTHISGEVDGPTEIDHHLEWKEFDTAVVNLFHEHQRWAVRKALSIMRNNLAL